MISSTTIIYRWFDVNVSKLPPHLFQIFLLQFLYVNFHIFIWIRSWKVPQLHYISAIFFVVTPDFPPPLASVCGDRSLLIKHPCNEPVNPYQNGYFIYRATLERNLTCKDPNQYHDFKLWNKSSFKTSKYLQKYKSLDLEACYPGSKSGINSRRLIWNICYVISYIEYPL